MRQKRKEELENAGSARSPIQATLTGSVDSIRSPTSARAPSLSNVPEEDGAFAIGDDEESENEDRESTVAPSASSIPSNRSRTPSISSSVDDAVPTQLRGMSEKARGKMPVGTPTFSRVNSMTSITSHTNLASTGSFTPSPAWVGGFY